MPGCADGLPEDATAQRKHSAESCHTWALSAERGQCKHSAESGSFSLRSAKFGPKTNNVVIDYLAPNALVVHVGVRLKMTHGLPEDRNCNAAAMPSAVTSRPLQLNNCNANAAPNLAGPFSANIVPGTSAFDIPPSTLFWYILGCAVA